MYEKSYQTRRPDGIQWSKWFPCKEWETKEKWQLKGKLLNRYRKVTLKNK